MDADQQSPPALHSFIVMNPRSGGGKVVRFDLANKARALEDWSLAEPDPAGHGSGNSWSGSIPKTPDGSSQVSLSLLSAAAAMMGTL